MDVSPLVVGDELYTITDAGIAVCYDAKTGKRHWQKRLGRKFWASPVYADGRIYCLDDSGKTTVLAPGKKFRGAGHQRTGRPHASVAGHRRRRDLSPHRHAPVPDRKVGPGRPLAAKVAMAASDRSGTLVAMRVIWLPLLLVALLRALAPARGARGDTLDEIHERGTLIWGADAEGGGPYVYPSPDDPRTMIGFEAELADALAGELGVKAQFFQGPWHSLLDLLGTRQIDVVLNGYELTPARAGRLLHTRPYYVYQLVLLGRRDNARLTSWDDLRRRPPAATN